MKERKASRPVVRVDKRRAAVDSDTLEEQCHPRKIFIGGLAHKTTTQQLREHFARYGTIVDAVVLRWPDGRSRGFGYVTFSDTAAASTALQASHCIGGREVDVKRAVPGTNKIFIGGLPQNTTANELREHFETYGVVSDAVVMIDPSTSRSRGFGFVCFLPGQDGAAAVASVLEQYDHHRIRGKWIEVKSAAPPHKLCSKGMPAGTGCQESSGGATPVSDGAPPALQIGGRPIASPLQPRCRQQLQECSREADDAAHPPAALQQGGRPVATPQRQIGQPQTQVTEVSLGEPRKVALPLGSGSSLLMTAPPGLNGLQPATSTSQLSSSSAHQEVAGSGRGHLWLPLPKSHPHHNPTWPGLLPPPDVVAAFQAPPCLGQLGCHSADSNHAAGGFSGMPPFVESLAWHMGSFTRHPTWHSPECCAPWGFQTLPTASSA